jgi:hypothetical protein
MECIEFFELSMISREKEKGGYNKKRNGLWNSTRKLIIMEIKAMTVKLIECERRFFCFSHSYSRQWKRKNIIKLFKIFEKSYFSIRELKKTSRPRYVKSTSWKTVWYILIEFVFF